MPTITDSTVVGFSDEVVRPLSDHLTGMKLALEAELVRWNDQIKPLINVGFVSADLIADGSGGEGGYGRVQLTKGDLVKFWVQVEYLLTLLNGASPVQTVLGSAAFADVMKPHVKIRMPI